VLRDDDKAFTSPASLDPLTSFAQKISGFHVLPRRFIESMTLSGPLQFADAQPAFLNPIAQTTHPDEVLSLSMA
jgi:hypothetical protein